MHLFLPYLLNDSQTIRSTIHFSKPLLCVTLICSDWSNWSHFHFIIPVMPDKAAFVRAELLCVQRYQETAIFTTPKAPSGKKWICIFIQTNIEKTNKWADNMFQWFRVDSFFWERITLYTVHFQI